jgi:hypothetical protein
MCLMSESILRCLMDPTKQDPPPFVWEGVIAVIIVTSFIGWVVMSLSFAGLVKEHTDSWSLAIVTFIVIFNIGMLLLAGLWNSVKKGDSDG